MIGWYVIVEYFMTTVSEIIMVNGVFDYYGRYNSVIFFW